MNYNNLNFDIKRINGKIKFLEQKGHYSFIYFIDI